MKKIISIFMAVAMTFTLTTTTIAAPTSSDTDKSSADEYYQPKDKLWPKAPNIASPAAILMDSSTGTILYGKNIDEKHYPASTTKLLTSIIALENSNLNETVEFSHNAIFSLESGSTHIGLVEGEKISMKDCLYALLLASANEVANGIAEHISGTTSDFAKLMNQYAKNIGCKNSHFMNPSGLHDDNHYTTCRDLALISQYALKNPVFREIDSTTRYSIGTTNLTNEKRTFTNHHEMLVTSKQEFAQYLYDGCVGGKTGYTSKANHTLVTFGQHDDTTLICVVMNTSTNDQYADSYALLDYGFDNFTSYNISKTEGSSKSGLSGSDIFNRYFNIANYEDSISIDSSSNIIIPSSIAFSDVKKDIKYNSSLSLVEGENNIGTITYSFDNINVGSTNINLNCSSESLTPILKMPQELTSSSNEEDDSNSSIKSLIFKILKITGCVVAGIIIIVVIFFIFNNLRWNSRRYKSKYRHRNSNDHFQNYHF